MTQFPDLKFKKVCETASEREAEIKEAMQAVSEVPNQILHDIKRHPRDSDGLYPVTLVFRFVPPWEQVIERAEA